MPRDITISFDDGTSHTYQGAPDDVTPDQVEQRAMKEFAGKKIKNIDGGKKPAATDNNVTKHPSDPLSKVVEYGENYASGVKAADKATSKAINQPGDNFATGSAKAVVGAGETALGIAGGVVGDVAGAVTGHVAGADTGEKIKNAIQGFTAPRTEAGKAIAGEVGAVAKPLGDLAELLPKYLEEHGHKQAAMDLRAVIDVAGGEEAALGKGAKAALKDVSKVGEAKVAAKIEKALPETDRQAALKAQNNGYALPPSQTGAGGLTGKVAEGVTGTVAKGNLKEDLAIKNQTNSEKLVLDDLGIKGVPLTEDVIAAEKRKVGQVWTNAENLKDTPITKAKGLDPNVLTAKTFKNNDFVKKVKDIESSVKDPVFDTALKKEFTKLKQLKTMTSKQMSTVTKRLRDKSKELYNGSNPTDGEAAKKLADVLDETYLQHLKDTGQPANIIADVQSGRSKYARLTAVENAFGKDGVFDARKLADRNDYLTGKLKDVAEFATKYRDYAKPIKTASGPSRTELAMHGAAIVGGKMTLGLAAVPSAAYAAGRGGRALIKSDRFQKGSGKAQLNIDAVAERVAKMNAARARKRAAARTGAALSIADVETQNQ